MLIRASLQTPLLRDTFVFPLRDKEATIKWLLEEVHRRYEEWHYFKVYEFTFEGVDEEKLDKSQTVKEFFEVYNGNNVPNHKELKCKITESKDSIEKRKEDERKAEEERKRLEEEARRLREERAKKIAQLKKLGHCWELENYSNFINVPLEEKGMVVLNNGSLDQWCCIRYVHPIVPAYKQFYYEVCIEELPETTNTWKVCVGCVPMQFKPAADRHWVGAQHSWAYIAGTGGKCHNSGKSTQYADTYGANDTIGVLLDFVAGTISFYKNGKDQGVAFENLKGPVYPAVSLTAKGCRVRLKTAMSGVPTKYQSLQGINIEKEKERRQRWDKILSAEYETKQLQDWDNLGKNSWCASFSKMCDEAIIFDFARDNSHKENAPQIEGNEEKWLIDVINQGSDDKWRVARSIGVYSEGIQAFEVEILKDSKTTNTWRICVGCIPVSFSSKSDRIWVGSQSSWAYIAGTGGKCFNSGQSTAYGERYSVGDVITTVMNFDTGQLEFFKNGDSQGICFDSLKGQVHAAVSLTAQDSMLRLRDISKERTLELLQQGSLKRQRLKSIMEKSGNMWDIQKLSNNLQISSDGMTVTNTGSKDKWRACAAVLPFQSGRRYFEVNILECPDTTNTWKICVGVVTKQFNFAHKKLWIGSQHSWSYIMGTGGKCHHSGKSTTFGNKYCNGDRIGVLMDFDNHTLEFFRNDVPQGEAFSNLYGPVFAAVSLTATNAKVQLNANVEKEKMDELFLFQ